LQINILSWLTSVLLGDERNIYKYQSGGVVVLRTPQRKEDINEEDSLTGANLMHYI